MTGDSREIAWILEDNTCGQFAFAHDSEIEVSVAKHFFFEHHRVGELVEGRDWRRSELPTTCDICGTPAEPPWWKHIATPRLEQVEDIDGRWLVCDPCHELVIRKDTNGLVRRAWAHAREASPWVVHSESAASIQDELRSMIQLAVERFDAGRRETL